MRPVNIYALTRTLEPERQERLERQLSGREQYLKYRRWELEGLRSFSSRLCSVMAHASGLCFYYSFTMPKLGKEFDLLRINDDYVINVEIKSGLVSDEAIRKQLLQNRYYLASLGRATYSYTYISSNDRLLRLSKSGRLIEAEWEQLAALLAGQLNCYDGDVEELFKEEHYLISPLTDPGRFLRQEYFLTFQQRDIKKKILRQIKEEPSGSHPVIGFCGLPGTGKSILLYDLAMELSRSARVCVFHFGLHARELEQLDSRLKRVDFYYGSLTDGASSSNHYNAILVDEGHKMDARDLDRVLGLAESWSSPVIISYDVEDVLAPAERMNDCVHALEGTARFTSYHLTNRIRLNRGLSAFIQSILCVSHRHARQNYPNVVLLYSSDSRETGILASDLIDAGYTFVYDRGLSNDSIGFRTFINDALCREFDRILMCIDATFFYDGDGYLRSSDSTTFDSRVRNLFHGLSRAKNGIAIIVEDNPAVFDRMLGILQGGRAAKDKASTGFSKRDGATHGAKANGISSTTPSNRNGTLGQEKRI